MKFALDALGFSHVSPTMNKYVSWACITPLHPLDGQYALVPNLRLSWLVIAITKSS